MKHLTQCVFQGVHAEGTGLPSQPWLSMWDDPQEPPTSKGSAVPMWLPTHTALTEQVCSQPHALSEVLRGPPGSAGKEQVSQPGGWPVHPAYIMGINLPAFQTQTVARPAGWWLGTVRKRVCSLATCPLSAPSRGHLSITGNKHVGRCLQHRLCVL